MDYQTLLDGMRRYGSTERDICLHGLRVPPEAVRESVIVAPWWEPGVMPDLGGAEPLTDASGDVKVW